METVSAMDLPEALSVWLARHRPAAAYLRRPAIDDDPRPAGDLDLLVFDDAAEELWVERHGSACGPSLDLLRLPAAWLDDPARLAAMGLITHRLLSADAVGDTRPRAAQVKAAVAARWREPAAVATRLTAFLDMGWLTVREVGVTQDWPALARFWLHMAQAAALAAAADAAGLTCPNVYTRPLAWARRLDGLGGAGLAATLTASLGLLDTEPHAAAAALRALHRRVHARCPEPVWPAAMRASTRREYRYWLAPAELEERVAAALALADAGDPAAAVFYLRYAAYSMLRLAMLHQRALERWPQHVPFIRPETEVRPDLDRHHPDLPALAEQVLGPATAADLATALDATQALREATLQQLAARGIAAPDLRPWVPFVHHTLLG